MFKYILKRIGYMLVTLLIISAVTFFMMHSIPGDPLGATVNKLPEQARANYYAKYGLDKPVTEQYAIFLKNLVTQGDLGESLKYPGQSITHTLLTNSKVSATTGGLALVMFIAILGITVPVFVLAALLQYFFTVKWMILPTTGWGKPEHIILPVIAMAFGPIATYARYLKSNMLEVMGQDYILTAEAKGVSGFNVIKNHVLKNAILPCITMLGGQISGIFTGSFVVEKMFGIPGLGFYFVSSINDRDYTMIIGTTIFAAALFVVAQLLIDIAYTLLDPRIRVAKGGK